MSVEQVDLKNVYSFELSTILCIKIWKSFVKNCVVDSTIFHVNQVQMKTFV